MNPERKLEKSAFKPVQRYIELHYLDAEKLASPKDWNKRVGSWIAVKLERLIKWLGMPKSEAENIANVFMKNYYENIIMATVNADYEATRRVLETLGLLPQFEQNASIVNCFEMAIAIYFLDVNIMGKVLDL